MTRPTQQQIDGLKAGDRVLVEGVVFSEPGAARVLVTGLYDYEATPVDHSAIHSILPREIKVGDRVTPTVGNDGPGEVRSIEGKYAWVRHDRHGYMTWDMALLEIVT